MPVYLPYEERIPDYQYRDTLELLLKRGVRSTTQQSEKGGEGSDSFSLKRPVVHSYQIENGFPWETGRSVKNSGFMAINELMAFVNGVRSNDVLKMEWGVPFWDSTFVDPQKCAKRGLIQGDLGPASYAVLRDFPTKEGPFNQMEAVIDQIKELPHLKTHMATSFYPPGIYRGKGKVQSVVTVPCHGSLVYFTVLDGKMNMIMVQRSADMLVGEPHNRIQYAALFLAVAHITGYETDTFSVVFLNPHYYANQVKDIEEFLSREPVAFPTVTLKNPPDTLFKFRREHFELTDYHPGEAMKNIPVSA